VQATRNLASTTIPQLSVGPPHTPVKQSLLQRACTIDVQLAVLYVMMAMAREKSIICVSAWTMAAFGWFAHSTAE